MRNPIRNVGDLAQFQVNRKDQLEVVRQTLYDFQAYAAAGVSQQTFFTVPAGTAAKTLASTNMTIAGSLPAPQRFLVQAIEVYFFPGVLPAVGPIAVATDTFVNDVWKFYASGSGAGVFNPAFFQLFIGSKAYLTEGAALMRFPPFGRLDGFAGMSDATTAAAALYSRTSYATAAGRPYILDPAILIEPSQNFNATLNWPVTVQTVTTAGEVGVVLNGVLVRNSQ
jgi:hypothetical protein